jgi:hypothetical protein
MRRTPGDRSYSRTDAIPCTGCVRQAECAAVKVACRAFAAYLGGFGRRRIAAAAREPTLGIYRRLYATVESGKP